MAMQSIRTAISCATVFGGCSLTALTDPWISIRRANERNALREFALVLTAVNIENRIEPAAYLESGPGIDGNPGSIDDWCLLVPEGFVEPALRELEDYRLENPPVVARVVTVRTLERGWVGVLGYLLVIWAQPFLESLMVFDLDWRAVGQMEAGSVMAGQWWRTFTALTLHADIAHIIGNSLFGAVFGLFVGRYLGSGFGWLLILLSGAIGNGLNAWLQVEEFRSIGASTATFGALAIGGAYVWHRGYFRGGGLRRGLAPIFAGIALLAYTGVGGENTDVVAHFTGFAAGVCLGILAATFDIRRLGHSGQYIAGALAVGLLIYAWLLAASGG